MELSKFKPVIVRFDGSEDSTENLEQRIYTGILEFAGLGEPHIVDGSEIFRRGGKEGVAKEVARIVGENKAVIISRKHYVIAHCYSDTPLVLFDGRTDNFPVNEDPSLGDGNFLYYRLGHKYVLGSYENFSSPDVKIYKPKKIERFLKGRIPDRMFLSLDISVFDTTVTKAYSHPHRGSDNFLRRLGYERYLSFEQVLRLSEELVKGRILQGLNIAGYIPDSESPEHKTADLLRKYIPSIIESQDMQGQQMPLANANAHPHQHSSRTQFE